MSDDMATDSDVPVGHVRGSDGPRSAAFQQTTGTIICADCGDEFVIHGVVVGITPVGEMFELDIIPSEADKTQLRFHQMMCTGEKE